MQTADLGVIVTCCELAWLDLMDEGDYEPSDERIAETAKRWAGAEKTFDDRDLSIVLAGMGLGNKLRKEGADYASSYADVPNRLTTFCATGTFCAKPSFVRSVSGTKVK